MKKPFSGRPMPLLLIKLPIDEKEIYNSISILQERIQVEPLRTNGPIGQCHRGQKYKYAQSRCTATRKCVRCSGYYDPGKCKLSKSFEAICTNCGVHTILLTWGALVTKSLGQQCRTQRRSNNLIWPSASAITQETTDRRAPVTISIRLNLGKRDRTEDTIRKFRLQRQHQLLAGLQLAVLLLINETKMDLPGPISGPPRLQT